jgi:hypothetical protein
MELVVFVGALALLAVASGRWGEDSRDYERGSGLIEVYTVEDEMRLGRALMDRRASLLSAVAPRVSPRRVTLPRAALAALASALGGALVRVGNALQRRAIAGV